MLCNTEQLLLLCMLQQKVLFAIFTNGWEFQGWNSNDSFCLAPSQFHNQNAKATKLTDYSFNDHY